MQVAAGPANSSIMNIVEAPGGSAAGLKDRCTALMRIMLDNMLKENGVDVLAPGFAQNYQDTLNKLINWCQSDFS